MISELSYPVIEKLGWYVYELIDPISNKGFYIGKGTGNRVLQHVNGTLKNIDYYNGETDKSLKINKILEIIDKEYEVQHKIICSGLSTQEDAYKVEAAFIAKARKSDKYELTNIASGHHENIHNITIEEFISLNDPIPIEINPDDKILFINVNQSFNKKEDIYNYSKNIWHPSTNRMNKIDMICIVYRNIVKAVFNNIKWYDYIDENGNIVVNSRGNVGKEFSGDEVKDSPYLNKTIKNEFTFNQMPLKYINC